MRLPLDLTGMTVVITGAGSGIGAEAARRLAGRGATVVPVGRTASRVARLAAEIGAEPLLADFTELAQVRALAADLLSRCPRIDVLVNNAGGLFTSRRLTVDGHETTFQVNQLAPFLLTSLLPPRLRASARDRPVRVVTTAGQGHTLARLRLDDVQWERRRYLAYCTTTLMNILFTRELARRAAGTDLDAFSADPDPGRGRRTRLGAPTNLFAESRLGRRLVASPLRRLALTDVDGARSLVWMVIVPQARGCSGSHFVGFAPDGRAHALADDEAAAARLWELSADLAGAPRWERLPAPA